MKIISSPTYMHACRQAANIISAQVILKPDSVLGLATGSTPLGVYRQLIRWHQKGDLDFSACYTVNLDEYVGLSAQDAQSYAAYMQRNFFSHVNIDPTRTHIPNGCNPNAQEECAAYDCSIRQMGGVDLQLLGLGHNGHIGFNEPDVFFPKGTHCVQLTEATLHANRRFFPDGKEMPRFAYTMGICDILQATRVVLLVSGAEKAQIVRTAFFGPITPAVPASILQLHKNFTLIGDEAALSAL